MDLELGCVAGAAPQLVSQRTIYAVKVSHMVCPPSSDQGGWIGCSVHSSEGRTKNIKWSQWFQHLLHLPLSLNIMDSAEIIIIIFFSQKYFIIPYYTLSQKYSMLLYVLSGFFNLVSFLEYFLGNLFPLQLFLICIFAVYFM